jgi:integrase
VWTKEEVDLLCKELSYVDGTVPQKRIQEVALAFKIGLCTMQRSQEILLNTPNNVDLEAGLLWIPKEISKTGEARHVVLVKNAIELYKLALDIPRNKETIFNLTPSSKDTLFRVYRDRIGLKGKTFHDSRRTSQSMLSEHMDMQELMTSGGWKDPKIMFKVYHVQNAKKTAERLKDIEITM